MNLCILLCGVFHYVVRRMVLWLVELHDQEKCSGFVAETNFTNWNLENKGMKVYPQWKLFITYTHIHLTKPCKNCTHLKIGIARLLTGTLKTDFNFASLDSKWKAVYELWLKLLNQIRKNSRLKIIEYTYITHLHFDDFFRNKKISMRMSRWNIIFLRFKTCKDIIFRSGCFMFQTFVQKGCNNM